jgi:hypothetical protein
MAQPPDSLSPTGLVEAIWRPDGFGGGDLEALLTIPIRLVAIRARFWRL